ncbi:MAG TPA: hypothetical protein VGB83_10540 [Actinomycetota bacterium]
MTLANAFSRSIVRISSGRVAGRGKVLPRLQFDLEVQAIHRDGIGWVYLPHLNARLAFDGEILGLGTLRCDHPVPARSGYERQAACEIPITREALRFVNDAISGSRVDLTLSLDGAYYTSSADPSGSTPDFPKDEWERHPLIGKADLRIQVARSDWFTDVVQPIRVEQYIPSEIRLPKEGRDSPVGKALKHLKEAEAAFHKGDDASVFQRCYGALEALPGAKQNIFNGVIDATKRNALDDMTKHVVSFLHSGRHVAKQGEDQGTFPIDHRDASLALDLTKRLVSYVSQLV